MPNGGKQFIFKMGIYLRISGVLLLSSQDPTFKAELYETRTAALMCTSPKLLRLRCKLIFIFAGFELVFDHWGTICPLSKNFEGHFHF